ncbi:MAG: anti-sigma factor [Kaiparowitsia implicata GSE-PSE-MK54-09C]|jgi:anti-sigma-K factor RskA|nr:anti-sigma factor [Kaiparowitsia implicata GSE-PSE-MK54-09C]
MTHSSLPDNLHELISGYVLDDLSAEEAATLQQAIALHPELTAELDEAHEALDSLCYGLAEVAPPPGLHDRLLASAQATPPAALSEVAPPSLSGLSMAPRSLSRPSAPRRERWWVGVGGAIAAVALGAIALDNLRLRQDLAQSQQLVAALQQPDARLYAIAGTEEVENAAGRLVIDPNRQQVTVLVQDLPALPQGNAYRLWAVAEGSAEPAFCGQFTTEASGPTITKWALIDEDCSVDGRQLLITADTASAPLVPEGPLLMQSVL